MAFPLASVPKIPNTPTAFNTFVLFIRICAFAVIPADVVPVVRTVFAFFLSESSCFWFRLPGLPASG
jgi:hypothetical protein